MGEGDTGVAEQSCTIGASQQRGTPSRPRLAAACPRPFRSPQESGRSQHPTSAPVPVDLQQPHWHGPHRIPHPTRPTCFRQGHNQTKRHSPQVGSRLSLPPPYLDVLPEAGWPVPPDERILPKPPRGGQREAQRGRQRGRSLWGQWRHRTCGRRAVRVGVTVCRCRCLRCRPIRCRPIRCRNRCRPWRRRRPVGRRRRRAATAEAVRAIDAVGEHHRGRLEETHTRRHW